MLEKLEKQASEEYEHMEEDIEAVLMTTEDVSGVCLIPVGTLRYYRACGTGPASFKLGGRVRYRRADVLAWIAEQEQASRRGGSAA